MSAPDAAAPEVAPEAAVDADQRVEGAAVEDLAAPTVVPEACADADQRLEDANPEDGKHGDTEGNVDVTPEEMRNIIEVIAHMGKFWHDWSFLKRLLSLQLKQVLAEYSEAQMVNHEDGQQQNSLSGETYSELVNQLNDALLRFEDGPPFTLQRLCEILLDPKGTYTKLSKLALALEKNLLVTSTMTKCTDPYPAAHEPISGGTASTENTGAVDVEPGALCISPPPSLHQLKNSARAQPYTRGQEAMAEGEELVESAQDMPRVVAALAGILERVAERNDAVATPAELAAAPASAFRATTKPGISVRAYVARVARFAGCSLACYVVAYIYLDRLLRRGRRFALAVDSYSVHRLLITAVLAAVKFMDDICYNNAYFAKVGGISLMEMNYLEVDFLFGVGFDLNVTPETFGDYCAVLRSEMLCAEAPPAPPRLHCCLSEDDAGASCSSSQQQLAA